MDQENDISGDERDRVLMARIQKGDQKALAELIHYHQDSVYGTVARMLPNNMDVEDIAQQVFIRIWRAAHSYEATAKFTTWMYTILRNLVFNEYRRLSRKPTYSSDAIEEECGQSYLCSNEASPAEELIQNELETALDAAIAALPDKARLAIHLRRYEQKNYDEIAVILGISLSATKSLLFRARSELRSSLANFLRE